jgi:hypothetical protein
MRDQWQYKVLVGSGVLEFRWKDADDATDFGPTIGTEVLNRLGQEGWEVCAYLGPPYGNTLVLKRKKV